MVDRRKSERNSLSVHQEPLGISPITDALRGFFIERTGIATPEGPELRHSRDVIRKIIADRTVNEIVMTPTSRFGKKTPEGYDKVGSFLPAKVVGVDTKGKFMWWTLESPSGARLRMWCTYGMSGQWSRTPTKHTAATVSFEGGTIHFNDPRHFGTLKFVDDEKTHLRKLATLGPDVLEDGLTPDLFAQKVLSKPSRTIAEALMDQKTVSGVGNYLRSEILYDCKVDPWRCVTDVTSEEYVKLCEASARIAENSYKSQGATIKTYRNVDGSEGTTQLNFKAYSRMLCPSGHVISRKKDRNGRMMHWCALCQK